MLKLSQPNTMLNQRNKSYVISENIIQKRDYHSYNDSIKIDRITTINLTKREKESLKYVLLGYTAKETSKELNISFRTVEQYIHSLKKKFQCNTKGQLLIKAMNVSTI